MRQRKEPGESIERLGRGDRIAVDALASRAGRYVALLAAFDRDDIENIGKGRLEQMQNILRTLTTQDLS